MPRPTLKRARLAAALACTASLAAPAIGSAASSLPVVSYPVPGSNLRPPLVATGQGQLAVVSLLSGYESLVTRFGLDGPVVSSIKLPLSISAMRADERGRLWYVGIGGGNGAATHQLGLLDTDGASRTIYTFPPKTRVRTLVVSQGAAWVYDTASAALQRISENGEVTTTIANAAIRPSDNQVSLTASPDGGIWFAGGTVLRVSNTGGLGGLLGRVDADGQLSTIAPERRPGEKSLKVFRVQQDLTGAQQWVQLGRVATSASGGTGGKGGGSPTGSGESLARVLPSGALQRVPLSFTQGTRSKPWLRYRPPIGLLVAPDSVGGIWSADLLLPRIRYYSSVTRKTREYRVALGSRFGFERGDAVVASDGNLWLIGTSRRSEKWSLIKVDTP